MQKAWWDSHADGFAGRVEDKFACKAVTAAIKANASTFIRMNPHAGAEYNGSKLKRR